jgi:F-type H+-transporting ATPase subunit a
LKQHKKGLIIWGVIVLALLVACIAVGPSGGHGDVSAAMRDAVLHDVNRVSLFGLKDVNPALISAMVVTAILLLAAALLRIFVIPRFTLVPGKVQLVLETVVGLLDNMALVKEPGKCSFIGAYVFAAGTYIFCGTLFELFGIQAVATNGHPIALPAPLSDVNAAICMGCTSYLVILGGGISHAGLHGLKSTLKEFSLPISMSFRLFGALLSGLLVTELVYHYAAMSYVVPVLVGVMFTLLHALVQAYVLTMLVGMYYHEVSEKPQPKPKKSKKAAKQADA